MDSAVKGIETELTGLQKRSHELETLLADQEQSHARRILELTSRHRQVLYSITLVVYPIVFKEADSEMERLRSAHAQAERTLESRERSHRQRIRGLEEQVSL